MNAFADLTINAASYDWGVRAFSAVEKVLGLNIALHDDQGLLHSGDIFLFNHFARFETVIPPYLIHTRTGAFVRSVADHGLFRGNDAFARLLRGVGAVPNDTPGLLPFLAAEILRGRKVVVFPEGGMVKDRRVLTASGDYAVFSRTARERRKHHRGAAVLALTLDIFKERVRSLATDGDQARLERWQAALGLESVDLLLERVQRPTLIVPGNITFFPLRIDDHPVQKAVEMFASGLSAQLSEELLIESNILFRETDMDIRLGVTVSSELAWTWWERLLLDKAFETTASLEDLFALDKRASRWFDKLIVKRLRQATERIRDACMEGMYRQVTVNLGHVVASVVTALLDRGRTTVPAADLHALVYLTVKALQSSGGALHDSILAPDQTVGLIDGRGDAFEGVIRTAARAELLEVTDDGAYRFLPKLRQEHDFDRIRLENPLLVAANEVAPLPSVRTAVAEAMMQIPRPAKAGHDPLIGSLLFDDEVRAWRMARARCDGSPPCQALQARETAAHDGRPFLLRPPSGVPASGRGVLLIHGFLAAPEEMRGLGERLAAAGHVVLGMRLPGHGTSPWDLRDYDEDDWLAAVRQNWRLLRCFTARAAVVGFSTGGTLTLRFAAERPRGLIGIAAVAAPVGFRDSKMKLVPLVHSLNRITAWLPPGDGIAAWHPNDAEHPEVNYRTMPLQGLMALRRAVADAIRHLPDVQCPVLVVQGDADPVVDPRSAQRIASRLGSRWVRVETVKSTRHGILYEDIGGTQEMVTAWMDALAHPPVDAGTMVKEDPEEDDAWDGVPA